MQVPVCPLCNNPVPIRKGEIPDAVVGEHIDRDCKYRPGKREKVRSSSVSALGSGWFPSGEKGVGGGGAHLTEDPS